MKLGQIIICSNLVYLPLFGPKIPCLSIFSITYLHLTLFIYIWPNIAFITLIWSYLPLIVLIGQHVPYSPPDRHSSIETAPLCTMLEQSDNYSWRYCISKNWGIKKVLPWMQFICLSSQWQLFVYTFWCYTHVANFKAIGQLAMEMLHLKDLRDTASAPRMQLF